MKQPNIHEIPVLCGGSQIVWHIQEVSIVEICELKWKSIVHVSLRARRKWAFEKIIYKNSHNRLWTAISHSHDDFSSLKPISVSFSVIKIPHATIPPLNLGMLQLSCGRSSSLFRSHFVKLHCQLQSWIFLLHWTSKISWLLTQLLSDPLIWSLYFK